MSGAPTLAVTFVADLARFRRQALRMMFVRDAITAFGVAAIVVVTVVVLTQPSVRLEVAVFAGALMAALIGAGVTTYLRRPGLRETAALIDARCRMDDGVTAALQFAGDADPVSRLVVEQGYSRLSRITPADAFPSDWMPQSKALSGVAIFAVVVLAAPRIINVPHWAGVLITGGGSVSPLPDSNSGPIGQPIEPAASEDPIAPAGAADRGRQQSPFDAPQLESSTTSALGVDTNPPNRNQPSSPSPGEVRFEGSDRPNLDSNRSPAQVQGATGSPSSSDLTAGAAASDRSGGSGPGAGRSRRESRSQAGGVSSGRATNRPGSPDAARQQQDYAARYREAAARAEEAVAREQIPEDLRDTVRTYFTAIRP
jgi:hypothetical protein